MIETVKVWQEGSAEEFTPSIGTWIDSAMMLRVTIDMFAIRVPQILIHTFPAGTS